MSRACHFTSAPCLFYAMACECCYEIMAHLWEVLLPTWLRNQICKSHLHISTEIILKNKAMLNIELPHTFSYFRKARLTEVNYREGANYYNKSFVLMELGNCKHEVSRCSLVDLLVVEREKHSERKSVHSLESDAIRRYRGILLCVHL